LVKVKPKVTVWPTADTDIGLAVFCTVKAGAGGAVTVAVEGGEVTGVVEPGGMPDAVAVLTTEPASISVWVTT
jgi:hypothetical protein